MKVGNGYIYGRVIFPFVVRHEDNLKATWVFFIIMDTGAPLTYLLTPAECSSYLWRKDLTTNHPRTRRVKFLASGKDNQLLSRLVDIIT